jgi:hypothetical protein
MYAEEFYNAAFDDQLSPLRRLVKEHRREMYDKVKAQREKSFSGEERYPKRLSWDEQKHPGDSSEDFVRRYNYNVKNGLWVHSKVEWLVPFEEIEYEYDWKEKNDLDWDDYNYVHEQGKSGMWKQRSYHKNLTQSPGLVPENPLLAITVTPIANDFPVARYRIPNEPFHCSLAKYWDLGPDIYDPGHCMETLLRKFHNKRILLRLDPSHLGDRYWDKKDKVWKEGLATTMSLNEAIDPIASDWWASWAKAQGGYIERDWHISL